MGGVKQLSTKHRTRNYYAKFAECLTNYVTEGKARRTIWSPLKVFFTPHKNAYNEVNIGKVFVRVTLDDEPYR